MRFSRIPYKLIIHFTFVSLPNYKREKRVKTLLGSSLYMSTPRTFIHLFKNDSQLDLYPVLIRKRQNLPNRWREEGVGEVNTNYVISIMMRSILFNCRQYSDNRNQHESRNNYNSICRSGNDRPFFFLWNRRMLSPQETIFDLFLSKT